ncbi:radical SAM protein [Fonticella tunisiensis]|uniref:Putative pyruvate formate lyase activating enzyme n=1 Tax=Fonticella tunisiensis TaxID=1096341 RepID=A0A4R7KTE7_9CLOT|nr:radical SAM protein [Fonticella tunisiensis]TDT63368.1 putative pyruvate formate lyase activating enzyme [Fonticella tunisiensis]
MDKIFSELMECRICPRNCGVNRYEKKGYCKAGDKVFVAKAFLHTWEEPCISGERGSGTVFFSNCNLGCVFCQNDIISHGGHGKEISIVRLYEIFLELQAKGAHNINLVTPTHYIPQIREALVMAKERGLKIPVIYNSNAYEREEALKGLEGLIDVYLPDIKYFDNRYSVRYSKAPDYFKYASKAVLEMFRQVGTPVFDDRGLLKKGLMIRHLMIPGLLFDSKKIVDWVLESLPREVYFNIMCQYTPLNNLEAYPEIRRKVNRGHYESLIDYAISKGLENGFIQDFESATDEYVPDFNLEGV